jgi:hypothetical protein
MAMLKKCDRCGILYDPYPVGNIPGIYNTVTRLRVDKFGNVKARDDYVDLCLDCMKKLERFLRNAGNVI